MMYNNHAISYQNIASKYYRFSPEDLEAAITDFRDLLVKYDAEPTGRLFYAMLGDPTDEIMLIELFMQIEEDNIHFPTEEEIMFRSYFNIEPMAVTRIMGDFEEEAQVKYWQLLKHVQQSGYKRNTPVFVELKVDNQGANYVEMSIGIKKERSVLGAGGLR